LRQLYKRDEEKAEGLSGILGPFVVPLWDGLFVHRGFFKLTVNVARVSDNGSELFQLVEGGHVVV